jgi:fluoride exporter
VPALLFLVLKNGNMLRTFLLVGVGGAVGSMLRYGISQWANKMVAPDFPWGTFAINLTGCLLIGVLFGASQRYHVLQGDAWLVFATGFCGGFTTFSAFALEHVQLFGKQQSFSAVAYGLLSVVLGIALCRLGVWLAR